MHLTGTSAPCPGQKKVSRMIWERPTRRHLKSISPISANRPNSRRLTVWITTTKQSFLRWQSSQLAPSNASRTIVRSTYRSSPTFTAEMFSRGIPSLTPNLKKNKRLNLIALWRKTPYLVSNLRKLHLLMMSNQASLETKRHPTEPIVTIRSKLASRVSFHWNTSWPTGNTLNSRSANKTIVWKSSLRISLRFSGSRLLRRNTGSKRSTMELQMKIRVMMTATSTPLSWSTSSDLQPFTRLRTSSRRSCHPSPCLRPIRETSSRTFGTWTK